MEDLESCRARNVYLKMEGAKSVLLMSIEGASRVNTDKRILQFLISKRPESALLGQLGRILDKSCIIFKNI